MNPYQAQYQQPQQAYNPYSYMGNQYSPYQNPYDRLRQLEQANPQFGQTVPQPQPQALQQMQPIQPAVRAIPVASIDEARAANVLDGSIYLFYNTGSGQIYSRQFDIQTGKADTVVYERTTPIEVPAEQPQPVNEVQELRDRVKALESKIEGLERGVTNESQRDSQHNGTTEPESQVDATANAAAAKSGSKPRPAN